MILNIYKKNTNDKEGKEEICGLSKWQGELDFRSLLHQAIKELTTWEWYAVSDMNHSSYQQVFYGSLRPTINTDQSATESCVDKIR